ncbi:alkylation response protein AidB-like acyl-CoA dehydrogenase [Tumebacillus sp. BK434]|uniref:acyl-CoA dehydrogenase family protein n=1 Tax=Tumebacillus sp. BK434 TaxID=2512169 RepID=UPI001044181B|nr:acyl-CoA dehydrogenase family protein [Tumebacillus sp. BK434]TCP55597.1 alkylation response protein AidB-like acyl-CoA dehydrogenase [Tumebacillus sp. BK434]
MSDLKDIVRGGSFVITQTEAQDVFTPEDFTDEQKMIAKTTADFIEGEVVPHREHLEKLDIELTVKLLKQAGELGLLAADVPEANEGLELDKISSTLITEYITRGGSFALSHGAHVGIGTLPIVFFGNEEQKAKYLPDLASGAKFAAYCLTEPGSGSDALGAKATAVLNAEGTHYVLNGTKQFITNAGFADVFVVYAKVDGDKFSAFIVEKDYPGVSTGPEEKKMGIKASSTRPLILEDVAVPVENLLGEVGRGHVIAFNILNIGRYKLAAGCIGSSKHAIELSSKYANERKQFGQPIANFPLIREKLAEMNIRTYATESMVYRIGGLIDAALTGEQKSGKAVADAIAEYAIECSISKVFASEAFDFVVDEGVQIHGGYGFINEYPIETMYRDSRINRIFEGTNEVNRLLIPGTLVKNAMKGKLPLLQAAQALQGELMMMMPSVIDESETLAVESDLIEKAKKIFLMVGGYGVQKYMTTLEQHQEILHNMADIMIEIYAMESCLLRAKKQIAKDGEEKAQHKINMTKVYVNDTFGKIELLARETLAAMEEGDMLRTQLSVLKKLTRYTPQNTIAIKRELANTIVDQEGYVC